ncbi:MAG: hypothetical protein KJ904_00020 [Alphaproteobacteria bacterium]|uniref:Uncharacterized protein n=1 Tax=viral metagenome TaxID=1070528 RepID=A0A6M3LTU4_9ZZZZ|nr:hypothetical protein [Alphaproteobacteria bacterium]MBU0798642.1 hypothetical protein [Alphaproteobacteria bacterium]MBU0885528.1 hypothetical protein [Alphaproteobacteria bacterium]MBU1811894.1 hypothetical protein [Alphaproteobacteria bacterium]MBU2090458.1 hypothetical protein [Alphaproteobacteria bacterium]
MAFNRMPTQEDRVQQQAGEDTARRLIKARTGTTSSRFAQRQDARQRIAEQSGLSNRQQAAVAAERRLAESRAIIATNAEAEAAEQEAAEAAHRQEQEERRATASDQTMIDRAAQIADLCARHGVPEKASKFILDGIAPAEVERLIGRASAITALVEQARKIDARIDAGMARQLIANGATIKEARAAVINEMADLSDTIMIRGQVPPDATGPSAEQKNVGRWRQAFAKAGGAISRPTVAQQQGGTTHEQG